jgi:DNA-directed RNA polymerase subunit RPC12/RpoP
MPDEDETKSAPCPQCSGEMMLARIFPKFGAYPELRSYQCVDCGHMVTIEEEE